MNKKIKFIYAVLIIIATASIFSFCLIKSEQDFSYVGPALIQTPINQDQHSKQILLTQVDLVNFLQNKKITETCEPGEWGILLPDGSLPLVSLKEASSKNKNFTLAKWQINDNKLYILGSFGDDGTHKNFTLLTDKNGAKYLKEYSDNCGLEIGDTFYPDYDYSNNTGVTPKNMEDIFIKNFPYLKIKFSITD